MALGKTATVIAALAALGSAASASAQKMDKDAKKWLDDVRPIMLAEEEKTYRELKDKKDREEFQKIFWARRDPTPATPENEFQVEFERLRAEADQQFKVAGKRGSETDCGRVYLLLGKPEVMKSEPAGETPMLRTPETWTYRDRPGQTFAGGEAQITFSGNCELGQGNRYAEALNRVAVSKIRSMNLVYRGPDGRMMTLEEQKPKPSPTQTLLKTPRQDFPLVVERRMTMRPQGGNTYVAFLVQAPPNAVTPSKVIVSASATDAAGAVATLPDREISGSAAPDGSFIASVGMTLAPGTYTINVALFDPATSKGSAVSLPVTVTDPNSPDVAVYTIALKGIQEGVTAKASDPLSAFTFGNTVFEPAPVFTPADSLMVLSFLYGGAKDEAGKTSVSMSIAIAKDGKTVGKLDDQKFETPASPTIGPIPLTSYAPGKYTVTVKVKDNVSKKDVSDVVTFEVAGAAPAPAK
jgi:GWxTD domain-containing protein